MYSLRWQDASGEILRVRSRRFGAFISATKEVVIPHKSFLGGVSDKKFRRYEIEAENIPPNVRWQIEDAYKRQFGVTEVPEDEVAEAYQAMKAR